MELYNEETADAIEALQWQAVLSQRYTMDQLAPVLGRLNWDTVSLYGADLITQESGDVEPILSPVGHRDSDTLMLPIVEVSSEWNRSWALCWGDVIQQEAIAVNHLLRRWLQEAPPGQVLRDFFIVPMEHLWEQDGQAWRFVEALSIVFLAERGRDASE